MQADYDQMTPAEKAVRDRVTTRNSERAVARAATQNTARQTEIWFFFLQLINFLEFLDF